jgi:hypothetical protein
MTETRDREYEEFRAFPDRGSGKLAHRARWIVAQLPLTDAELEFLATGKLPRQDDETKQ